MALGCGNTGTHPLKPEPPVPYHYRSTMHFGNARLNAATPAFGYFACRFT